MEFSDGMAFNTNGQLRIIEKSDGLYVVGQGMLIPVNSEKEAFEIMDEHKSELAGITKGGKQNV